MGDRINLRFVNNSGEVSPVLYAHGDGMTLISDAVLFWTENKKKIRHEPSNWMVNFLSYIHGRDPYDGDYYLYADFDGCSADDNGDWEFNTDTGVCTHVRMGEFDSSGFWEGEVWEP